MVNQEIFTYIQKSRQSGQKDDDIKKSLLDVGWEKDDVEKAFEDVNNNKLLSSNSSGNDVSPEKHRRMAVFFFVGPIIGLALVIAGFALSTVVTQSFGIVSRNANIIILAANVVFGFLGIFFAFAILPGIIIGIILLNKKVQPICNYDNRSGAGKNSIVPPEIKGWNWGAAGLSIIWGIYYRSWKVFWGLILRYIPIIGILWIIYTGFKGNEWAWKANKWESVSAFKESQDKWTPWGIIYIAFNVFFCFTRLRNLEIT